MEMLPLLLIVAIVGGGVLLAITTRNKIVYARNAILEALGSTDAQLQKRHDLIPNMVATAREFMGHEEQLLNRLTELRAQASAPYDRKDSEAVKAHIAAETAFQNEIGRFVATVEGYPDLKSSQHMSRLMDSLEETEANISAARRFYNAAVGDYRNAIMAFPGSLFARGASPDEFPFFEAEERARAPVNVAAQFRQSR